MNKKKSASAGIMSFCGEYSYILVFIAIFIVYAFTSSGLTWSGVMNVFRHSAVIGIIGIGMGPVSYTHLDVYKRQFEGSLDNAKKAVKLSAKYLRNFVG